MRIHVRAIAVAAGTAAMFYAGVSAQQAPAPAAPGGAAPAQAGRAGGGGGRGAATDPAGVLWAAFDANPKDNFVTGAEVRAAFDAWYTAADTSKSGSVTQAQLTTALGALFPAAAPPAAPAGGAPGAPAGAGGRGAGRGFAPFVAGATTAGLTDRCGGRSQKPTEACPEHIAAMMAALPATAPAKPVKAHKVLAWSRIPSAGFQHSSIPLAIKAIEELGKKTGSWTTDVSWDPAAITAANLKQYDAIFLSSTTGCFFDMAPEADTPEARAASKKATDERRAAFLEFVRSGKGVGGIHATGDSYHSPCPNDDPAAGGGRGGFGGGRGGGGPNATLASVILRWSWGLDDKKLQGNDQNLTRADMQAVADGWWGQLDPNKATLIPKSDFDYRIVPVITQANQFVGSPGRDSGRGSWPDWDNMIGGWFKFHWLDPQRITVKIDDKTSPLTKMFNGADFDVNDETYTFSVNSFSRENVHVLTSINYDKMAFMDRLKESNPRPDHDFGLSWIKKEGQGRLFYMALGHDERIYAMKPMMEHLLAGMQYALGDLKADDTPKKK